MDRREFLRLAGGAAVATTAVAIAGCGSNSGTGSSTTTTEPAMQRWPAAPKALARMFSAVCSITASGITTM